MFGDGDTDLVASPAWATNIEVIWENPVADRFLRRLGTFARVVLFDRRGSGLSDPVGLDETPSLDVLVEDTRAVMDAAGVATTAFLATGLAAGLGIYLTATHPEVVSALILHNATARSRRADDYPNGMPPALVDRITEDLTLNWGRRPAFGFNDREDAWIFRWQRLSLAPGAAVAAQRLYRDLDLRPLLPSIRVRTLVTHRRDNPQLKISHGRYLAEHIPGAQLVELDGNDPTFYVQDNGDLAEEIQAFLTGTRSRLDARIAVATILFTDIAGSTAHAAGVGDDRWSAELDDHIAMSRREVERHRGRFVKSTGDGIVATFDSATRAIQCAGSLQRASTVPIRAGLHTGECEQSPGGDLSGIAVHVAARTQAAAQPGDVLVTSTLKDLVLGSPIGFDPAGEHDLKGVPGRWTLWRVRLEP